MKNLLFIALVGILSVGLNSCEKENLQNNSNPKIELIMYSSIGETYDSVYVKINGERLGEQLATTNLLPEYIWGEIYMQNDLGASVKNVSADENVSIEFYDMQNDSLIAYFNSPNITEEIQYSETALQNTDYRSVYFSHSIFTKYEYLNKEREFLEENNYTIPDNYRSEIVCYLRFNK